MQVVGCFSPMKDAQETSLRLLGYQTKAIREVMDE